LSCLTGRELKSTIARNAVVYGWIVVSWTKLLSAQFLQNLCAQPARMITVLTAAVMTAIAIMIVTAVVMMITAMASHIVKRNRCWASCSTSDLASYYKQEPALESPVQAFLFLDHDTGKNGDSFAGKQAASV